MSAFIYSYTTPIYCYYIVLLKTNAMNIYAICIYYEYKCHWYHGMVCCNIMKYVMSDGMSKFLWYVEFYFILLLHLYMWCQYTNDIFNINIISLVCWHDLVVLVWNIYLMISWRWICFVCWHKWWYVEIGYVWLTVMSDGVSKCLWYIEFYFIFPRHLYLMSTYQWYF